MIPQVPVRIRRVSPEAAALPLPAYATEGSAGMDLCAASDAVGVTASTCADVLYWSARLRWNPQTYFRIDSRLSRFAV